MNYLRVFKGDSIFFNTSRPWTYSPCYTFNIKLTILLHNIVYFKDPFGSLEEYRTFIGDYTASRKYLAHND